MKNLLQFLILFALLAGCDSYRPEKLPEGTILETGTVIVTSINRSISVVANQSDTIYLEIDVLLGKKVRDLLIEGELTAGANMGTAIIEPRKLRISAGAVPLSGETYTKSNPKGLSIGCGKSDPSACGVFEIEKGSEVLVRLSKPVDLSGMVITSVENK